jgi:hypothetical protein
VNRAEMLKAVAAAHEAWSLEHGDDVPYVEADENPHDGETTDLSIHQADRSASPELDDPLNAIIKDLIGQLGEPSTPAEAITADADLRARAAGFLSPPELRPELPALRYNPHHGKGGRFASGGHGGGGGLTGQAALDSAPATLTPGPESHYGKYEGEQLDGPPGMGSARALSEYEGLEYQQTNDVLRGHYGAHKREPWETDKGWAEQQAFVADIKKEVGARVAEIDKTMAVSKLTSDVKVHRVIKDGKQVFGDAWHGDVVNWGDWDHGTDRWDAGERPNLTGLKLRDKGYVSTTARPDMAKEFGKRWPTANSGLQGEPVIMSMHVPKGVGGVQLSDMGGHAEILLQRGLTMTVTADHGVDADGFRQLDIEVTT